MITAAGKFGIGVTSPSTTLHLDSAGTPTTIQLDSDTEASIDFNDHGGSAIRYKIGTNISDNNGQFEIRDVTNSASRMRIDSSGNVGIGTTSPLRPLSIGTYGSGNAEIAFGSETSGYASLLFGDGSSGTDVYRGYIQYQHSSDSLLLATSAIARLTIDSSGNTKIDGNLNLDDNYIAKFGTGGELEILHDGSHSRIRDVGTGVLSLQSNDLRIHNVAATEYMARFVEDGQVELYYDNTKRFDTTSSGVEVHGNLQMDDNNVAYFGTGGDLEIFHDGTDSFIRDVCTGDLKLRGSAIQLISPSNEKMLKAIENAAVELYYDASKKAETVSGGFTVTGTCTATAFAGDGSALTGISAGATGGGSDEIFYENGQNVTTNYTITNGKNAMSAGPITIDSGVTVTVGSGETLTIV